MSSSPYVQSPTTSNIRQTSSYSDNYSTSRTTWTSGDMAQAAPAYRYPAGSHQPYYSTSRTEYDDQPLYSRRPQERPLTPPVSMDGPSPAYAINSYPDTVGQQSFGSARVDVYGQHQYYQNSQIPRSARNMVARESISSSGRYEGERDNFGGSFDSYGVPHSTSTISNITYPASDARRRSPADGAPNAGNGADLPWDQLPAISNTIPSTMTGHWAPNQFEPVDNRRQYDSWHSRAPSSSDTGSGFSSRFPSQSPSEYPSMYAPNFSESGPNTNTGGLGEAQPMSTISSNHSTNSSGTRVSPPPPRPYSCEICGFSFARNHDLTRHIRGHEPAQFGCERCGKAYTRLDSLRRHYVRKRCGPNYTAA